jgi:hypothetical protein
MLVAVFSLEYFMNEFGAAKFDAFSAGRFSIADSVDPNSMVVSEFDGNTTGPPGQPFACREGAGYICDSVFSLRPDSGYHDS